MKKIVISENAKSVNNLKYIERSLYEILSKCASYVNTDVDDKRAMLTVESAEGYYEIIKSEIFDKVSDVLAVYYKYKFFNERIITDCLNEREREILLTGIVSADLALDKRYTYKKLCDFNDLSIDGFYNFRMKILKEKWEEIVSFFPTNFTADELKEFITYLSKESDEEVYVDGNFAFDKSYNVLRKSELITKNNEIDILQEIILKLPKKIVIKEGAYEKVSKKIKGYFFNTQKI